MKYRVAIIGCGALGTLHAKVWSSREDSKIVAVYDILDDRTQKMATDFEATACKSLEEAIVENDVNVVSVCTPVVHHPDISCLAMDHGRHVICEKPIALTVAEAERMIAKSHEKGVKLVVGYQYRGLPRYIKCREIFRSGDFGGPIFFRYTDIREARPKIAMHHKKMNGGPVIDMAGHIFDIMRFITDEEPVRVYARGHIFGDRRPRLVAKVDEFAIDAAEINVEYSGGHVLATLIHWSLPDKHPGMGGEEIVGADLIVKPTNKGVEARYTDHAITYDLGEIPTGPTARIEDLVQAIENDTTPEVSGEVALIALRESLAALESIETNRAVDL
ncbi:MAG: Gfo/Idh/MocA family oxidoreductase [Lentisphaerae bacterium]|nr:Gfo/Idh/MocA family oxidoreductase [Lentisphaerota bacterium]